MEFELKKLSPEAVPRALAKAERYRLLNEPARGGEHLPRCAAGPSPTTRTALTTLLLAHHRSVRQRFVVARRAGVGQVSRLLQDPVRARLLLRHVSRAAGEGAASAGRARLRAPAYRWLREAMTWYEKAEGIRPPGNDDAMLRWNACARLIMRDHHLVPMTEDRNEPLLLE